MNSNERDRRKFLRMLLFRYVVGLLLSIVFAMIVVYFIVWAVQGYPMPLPWE